MDKEIRILAKNTVYDGYFQIVKIRYQHTLFNGGWSQPLERELFERGRVAAVLPYDPNIDSVLLIEQCRTGALNSEYSEISVIGLLKLRLAMAGTTMKSW